MYADNVLTNTLKSLKQSANFSRQLNLQATLVSSSISIPDGVQCVDIYPNVAMKVAFGEAAITTSTSTFVAGDHMIANTWNHYCLDNGLSRTLQFISSATGIIFINAQ